MAKPQKEASRKDRAWTVEEVDDLDALLDRLRATYDMYFQGIERTEPLTLRKQAYRLILQANPSLINNTGLRFRLRNLIQRFNVYQNYWNRVLMQIERGTYQRDVFRAQYRERNREQLQQRRNPHMQKRLERLVGQRAGEEAGAEAAAAGEAPAAAAPADAAGAASPGGAAAAPGAAAAAAAAGRAAAQRAEARRSPEEGYRDVYQELMRQRAQAGQSTEGMSFDLIAKRLAASRASIMASSGCSDVRFRVTVEEGKVKLKAVPVSE